jgi:LmbE family N-acetylglucosaminyl deacetylase
MRAVLLSPHVDDVAYSIGGWLAQRPFTCARLVSVFTTSCYTFDRALRDIEAVTRLRRAEDEAYAAAYGLALEHLGLPDSSILGMTDLDQRSASDLDDPRRETARAALAGALTGCELVVTPLALGGHVDHRLVASLVGELVADGKLPAERCLAYEDLPYANEVSLVEIAVTVARVLGSAARPQAIAIDLAAKRRAAELFGTQLQPSELVAIEAHAYRFGCGPVERIWHG